MLCSDKRNGAEKSDDEYSFHNFRVEEFGSAVLAGEEESKSWSLDVETGSLIGQEFDAVKKMSEGAVHSEIDSHCVISSVAEGLPDEETIE